MLQRNGSDTFMNRDLRLLRKLLFMTIIKSSMSLFLSFALLIYPLRLSLAEGASPSSDRMHSSRSASPPTGFIATDGIDIFTPSGKRYFGLTSHAYSSFDGYPIWCEADNRIYYLHSDIEENLTLRSMHLNGSGSITLQYFKQNYYGNPTISEATISPDGKRLAYTRIYMHRMVDERNLSAISIEDIDSGKVHEATSHYCDNQDPAWSPDSEKLAYMSYRNGSAKIWIMNRDGTHKHLVPNQPDGSCGSPVWSPDGRNIALRQVSGLVEEDSSQDLFTINLITGLRHFVTGNIVPVRVAWSPHGRYIAFSRRRNSFDTHYLYIINLDTGQITKVWPKHIVRTGIAWAPASKN